MSKDRPTAYTYKNPVDKKPTPVNKPTRPDPYGNRKARRAWRKQERIATMSRKSVRAVSGGLPSLGKR